MEPQIRFVVSDYTFGWGGGYFTLTRHNRITLIRTIDEAVPKGAVVSFLLLDDHNIPHETWAVVVLDDLLANTEPV